LKKVNDVGDEERMNSAEGVSAQATDCEACNSIIAES
jgi:hypothetical protein